MPKEIYEAPLSKAESPVKGKTLLVAYSYMLTEAMVAAQALHQKGIDIDIDIRSHRPLDTETILNSVKKRVRLITFDNGWIRCGIGSEVVSAVVECDVSMLKTSPIRLAIADVPISTRALANFAYPYQKTLCQLWQHNST